MPISRHTLTYKREKSSGSTLDKELQATNGSWENGN